ncbi:MAG TPA: outer membrane beta-barrel protein [Sphingomonas sp.]|nr:outer membrane beta-barrel protein [Sphingomonas sp.]
MKTCLVIAAALAGWSAQASAQDFNGPSVGVQAGWNRTDVRLPEGSNGIPGVDRSTDTFVGGAFLAYDYEVVPRIVIGGQAEFNVATSDDFGAVGEMAARRVNPRYAFDLTARAGYLVTPSTLLYVRGGYSNARVRTTIGTDAGDRSSSANRDGWMLGGGAERMITDHVSARLEYRYSDLGEGRGRFDRHQVLVGAAYRF